MNKFKNIIILFILSLYTVSSFIPLSKSDYWWIRAWDFPRLQFFTIGLFFLLLFIWIHKSHLKKQYFLLLFTVVALFLDGYRILPYTPIYPIESKKVEAKSSESVVSVLISNVYQKNQSSKDLLELIKKKSPDMILLLEINEEWIGRLEELKKEYPYIVSRPLENTYGLAFYSRLKIVNSTIHFLVETDVPSVQATIETRNGRHIEIFGVHPKPPVPSAGNSIERDAELILIAKAAVKIKTPVLVLGDLNDVAWSHTSRLFRRISELKDPRVGRGVYPTFPVYLPFWRFPLDYVFHSTQLNLVEIERLEDIGSDHFPLMVTFIYDLAKDKKKNDGRKPEDDKEANKIIDKAL